MSLHAFRCYWFHKRDQLTFDANSIKPIGIQNSLMASIPRFGCSRLCTPLPGVQRFKTFPAVNCFYLCRICSSRRHLTRKLMLSDNTPHSMGLIDFEMDFDFALFDELAAEPIPVPAEEVSDYPQGDAPYYKLLLFI